MGRQTVPQSGQELVGHPTSGDALAAKGLADANVVRRGLGIWRGLIVAEHISVLVADAAPLALLAARGRRYKGWPIRIVDIGTVYFVPPTNLSVRLSAFPRYQLIKARAGMTRRPPWPC